MRLCAKTDVTLLARSGASEPEAGARQHALKTTQAEEEETAWGDVEAAFELIPEAERPGWLERAKEALREQGTPWLEACVPVVRALAFEMWGLSIPTYPEIIATG